MTPLSTFQITKDHTIFKHRYQQHSSMVTTWMALLSSKGDSNSKGDSKPYPMHVYTDVRSMVVNGADSQINVLWIQLQPVML